MHIAVFRAALEHALNVCDSLIELAHIGELRIQHHAKVAIVRQLLHGFLRRGRGLWPLLGVAVGVDNLLIAAAGVLVPKRQHLAECLDRRGVVFLLAVDHAQPLDEDRAIVTIGLAGTDFAALLGFLQKILQQFGRFVIASLRLVDGSHAVGNFGRVRNQGISVLQIFQRQIVLRLPPVDFCNANVSLRVLGIRVGDDFVLFERSLELAIIQIIFGQTADCVQIVAVEHDRVLVRINRVFVFLALFVRGPECGIQLGRARRVGNRAQNLERMRRIALIGIEHRQCGDRLFRIGVDLDRGVQLGFRLLHVVAQTVQASEQQVIVYALRIELHDLLILFDRELQNVV